MRKWIFTSIVFSFLILSLDVTACGNSTSDQKKEITSEKSCCSSKSSGDEKKCCCSDSEGDEKETKKCDGSCKHKGCNTTTASSFYIKADEFIPLTTIILTKEIKNLWSYSQNKINPVYLSIWQPPKI